MSSGVIAPKHKKADPEGRLFVSPNLGVIGAPYGTRTRVSAVKGRRPRPLDEGR
jgi:hypothetical protein